MTPTISGDDKAQFNIYIGKEELDKVVIEAVEREFAKQ